MKYEILQNLTSCPVDPAGSFELTWQQIMVAVESALLMFPINILIVTIFRSIQPRVKNDDPDVAKTNSSDKSSVVSMQTILKVFMLNSSVAVSCLRNSVILKIRIL